jgi:hypothetical protein
MLMAAIVGSIATPAAQRRPSSRRKVEKQTAEQRQYWLDRAEEKRARRAAKRRKS